MRAEKRAVLWVEASSEMPESFTGYGQVLPGMTAMTMNSRAWVLNSVQVVLLEFFEDFCWWMIETGHSVAGVFSVEEAGDKVS